MATELLELQLEELSLVDRPANAEAMVTLFKRDIQPEETTKMGEDKIKAYMEEKGCGRAEAMKALGYETEKSEEESEAMKALEAEVELLGIELLNLGQEHFHLKMIVSLGMLSQPCVSKFFACHDM